MTLPQTAVAHGGDDDTSMTHVPVGPYVMTVWTNPGLIRVGTTEFLVAFDDTGYETTQDLAVSIQLIPIDGEGNAISSPTQPIMDPERGMVYTTDLLIQENGRYQTSLLVEDPTGLTYQGSFELEVQAITGFKWIIIILLLQAAVTFVWLIKEGLVTWSRQRRPSASIARG